MDKIFSEQEKGWLAAALDFEGSLSIVKKNIPEYKRGYSYSPYFIIAGTNKDIIYKVREILNNGSICIVKYKNPKWRPLYRLEVYSGALRCFLPQVFPFLIVKRKQAELILEALSLIKSPSIPEENLPKINYLRNQIKLLNRRGNA